MSASDIPRAVREAVFDRDGGRCRYCHLSQVGQGSTFHINHVRPRTRGGATVEDNLVVQCPWCSLHKSDKVTAADPTTGDWSPLLHPLRHPWSDHFAISDTGACRGRSPLGRATVAALQMNHPIPLLARLLQIRGGLLPPTER